MGSDKAGGGFEVGPRAREGGAWRRRTCLRIIATLAMDDPGGVDGSTPREVASASTRKESEGGGGEKARLRALEF